MKKTILLFISFLLLINILKAQKTDLGVHAFGNSAFYKSSYGDVSETSDMKVGVGGGMVLSVPIGKLFSFRPELNFVLKGGSYKDDDYKSKVTLNYLELPLNFVYNTKAGPGMFFGGLGPSVGFGLSGTAKSEEGGDEDKEKLHFGNDEEDDLKPLEIGINVTAGYQFMNGLFVDARFNTSLNNLIPGDQGDSDTKYKYHNSYFGVGIGYMFGLKTKAKPKPAEQQ